MILRHSVMRLLYRNRHRSIQVSSSSWVFWRSDGNARLLLRLLTLWLNVLSSFKRTFLGSLSQMLLWLDHWKSILRGASSSTIWLSACVSIISWNLNWCVCPDSRWLWASVRSILQYRSLPMSQARLSDGSKVADCRVSHLHCNLFNELLRRSLWCGLLLLAYTFEWKPFTCEIASLVLAHYCLLNKLWDRLIILHCLKRCFPQYPLLADPHSACLLPCHPVLTWLNCANFIALLARGWVFISSFRWSDNHHWLNAAHAWHWLLLPAWDALLMKDTLGSSVEGANR